MTPAELKTLRESLGLSQSETASLIAKRSGKGRPKHGRTVAFWEEGRNSVPEDAQAILTDLDHFLEQQVQRALEQVAGLIETFGREPAEIVLIRYRSKDFRRYVRGWEMFWNEHVHAVMLGRIRREMEKNGISCRIVWMVSDVYETWRKDKGREDTEKTRSEWAVSALEAGEE